MEQARKQKLAAIKAAVKTLCEEYQEEDILAALASHCLELGDTIEDEGSLDAAKYWRHLGSNLELTLSRCTNSILREMEFNPHRRSK